MTHDEATASRIASLPQSVATTGSNARPSGDYATTVSMLNEILSLGSEDSPAPPQRTAATARGTAATGPVGPPSSASSAPTGPRPVPEVALPPQPTGTPLAPDFFTGSKPRRGLGRRRS